MKSTLDIIRKYLVATVLKLAGFRAWLANIILKQVFKKIEQYFKKQEIKKEEQKKSEAAKGKYETIINDPNKTAEEKHQAIDDLFNR